MAWSTAKGAAIGFIIVVVALFINGLIAYRNVHSVRERDRMVAHTNDVLYQLEVVQSAVKDAETGQRGYLITGDDEYLEPYHKTLQELDGHLDRLAGLLSEDPGQNARLRELKQTINKRIAVLEQNIVLRREQGEPVAAASIQTRQGKLLMDEVRRQALEMEEHEKALLAERAQEAQSQYRVAIIANAFAILLGVGAIIAASIMIRRELDARKRATALAHAEGQRLLTTLTSIGDAVIVTDAAGKVTLMNRIAQKLTGWGDEARGQPLSKVFHIVNEVTRAEVENPVTAVLRKGTIVGLANHTVLISKDGTDHPIDDSGAPIRDEDHSIIGVVLVFRDIAERRRAEADRERLYEELRQAERHKDHFLATLAHELRNPLAPISNALQLWPMVENDRAEMEQLREMMERQVQQMIRLIDDLLDLSRITRGKVQLRQQTVDIRTVIDSSLEAIGPFLKRCSHELSVEKPDEPVWVRADVARLVQVVGNVLHNAAKYTGLNGKIRISAGREDNEAVIRIRDNGAGIPPEMLEKIFDMFTQVDQTLDRAQGGLGIGLTLSRTLVEMHHGTIQARSEGTGRGAEFVIRLPVQSSLPETDGHPADRPPQRITATRHRVLVVDDVEASATTLALMLRAIGQEVEVRHDGPSAIEAVAAYRPDVVFMDIGMPHMDGYEVARRLRQQPERPSITLVALTGYGQEEDRRRAIEAGFNYHLVKPTSLEALEQLLSTIPASAPTAGQPDAPVR